MKFALTTLLWALVQLTFAHPGIGIVEDSRGNVFYTDLEQVWKISPDGKKSIAVKNVHTHELYLDENDNLFGEHLWYDGEKLNTWGHYAWKLSNDGKFQKVIPDSEGFLTDYSFVRDHFGRMYWADRSEKCQHIIRKEKDNSKTVIGDKCMEDIRWMTSTDDGLLYVVDKHDVKKVDERGRVSTVMQHKQTYVGAVTVDKENNIYVADFTERKVTKLSVDGKSTVVFKASMPWSPTALIVASNGDYLVLETSITNSVRVLRISKRSASFQGRARVLRITGGHLAVNDVRH